MTTPTFTLATMDSVVVGRSARMRAVFEFLRVIGNSDSTVVVTGESGTGKEVTAMLIHLSSRRKHHPFVPVSCALFSETLIESELFGHERGHGNKSRAAELLQIKRSTLGDRINRCGLGRVGTVGTHAEAASPALATT